MPDLFLIPKSEFDRIAAAVPPLTERLQILGDMCRLNTLVEVKKAGSGHLGSSFSAMDLNVWLYFNELNVREVGFAHPDRDIFFSSKGHDVPGLYAVFHALGFIGDEKLMSLRRLGGLDGHPDVRNPGSEANTGSLGMGIGKGRGMAKAKTLQGRKGRVFVMTGDGELQEGQIWESLQTTIHQGVEVTVIVDHNKLQTDLPVEEVTSLGNLVAKFEAFGWHVERCDGHDFNVLATTFAKLNNVRGPKVLIADTIKGKGVSFMERISECASVTGKYIWHSGAPADEPFLQGFNELLERINRNLKHVGISELNLLPIPVEASPKSSVTKEYIAAAYGEELVRLGSSVSNLVVIDGDLAADCKVRDFATAFPSRFVENGIAEQDMVSFAGGLARQGAIPVCNSFSSFLCARANEQIYNNACEGTKIIYSAHFAGMIPAGPGKSHQSVRDIGLLGSIPNLIIVQPGSVAEARAMTSWAILTSNENVCLRLNIGPSPRSIAFPSEPNVVVGAGHLIREGSDAILFTYGPVMLNEALIAAELLQASGFSLAVANQPWLNRFSQSWLIESVKAHKSIYTLDDHMLAGGMGERLTAAFAESGLLQERAIRRFGLTKLPACGTPVEVLRHHSLDGASLARQILEAEGRNQSVGTEKIVVYNTLEAAQ